MFYVVYVHFGFYVTRNPLPGDLVIRSYDDFGLAVACCSVLTECEPALT